jgi:adenylate cyclase
VRLSIELDPEFASPHAAAAIRYAIRQTFGWGTVNSQEKKEMIALALRAVELDKDDAIVLTYSGYALVLIAHELETGAALLERATDANPNLAIAWTYRGYVNVHLGNPDDAIEYSKKALRLSPLDPLDFATRNGLATAYFFSGQYTDASKWAISAVRANPEWLGSR